MKIKNWKTTSTGIAAIAGGIAGIIFSIRDKTLNAELITAYITAILTGIGLVFAKDFNVTGGQNDETKNQ